MKRDYIKNESNYIKKSCVQSDLEFQNVQTLIKIITIQVPLPRILLDEKYGIIGNYWMCFCCKLNDAFYHKFGLFMTGPQSLTIIKSKIIKSKATWCEESIIFFFSPYQ
jgi:hypothetical protein